MEPEENESEENVRERHFLIDHNFIDMRLDQFLCNRIPRISRTFAQEIIRHGRIELVPPRKPKASSRLRLDDVVILRQRLEPESVQDAEARILFADEALVVINKPSGMLVHETASARLNTVTHYLLRQGFDEAEPVHRIDRDTSGIVVCAARRDLVAPLRGAFATTSPTKTYRALVFDPEGVWVPGTRRTLDTPLGSDPESDLALRMGPGDLESTTHVHALTRREHPMGTMADLEVVIETGRQHQIRIHLAMEGTPIAGDKLYSMDNDFFRAICDFPDDPELLAQLPFDRQALHAWKISLAHPITKESCSFEAPLPSLWGRGNAER
ncbi:MAG: pseudouridine synthase [Bradymonadaceae bacterium]